MATFASDLLEQVEVEPLEPHQERIFGARTLGRLEAGSGLAALLEREALRTQFELERHRSGDRRVPEVRSHSAEHRVGAESLARNDEDPLPRSTLECQRSLLDSVRNG